MKALFFAAVFVFVLGPFDWAQARHSHPCYSTSELYTALGKNYKEERIGVGGFVGDEGNFIIEFWASGDGPEDTFSIFVTNAEHKRSCVILNGTQLEIKGYKMNKTPIGQPIIWSTN